MLVLVPGTSELSYYATFGVQVMFINSNWHYPVLLSVLDAQALTAIVFIDKVDVSNS